MDKRDFDSILKGRLQDYSDPDFDESALTGLQSRLAETMMTPWYVQYQTLLGVTSALFLFTLLNFWMTNNQMQGKYDDLLNQMQSLQRDILISGDLQQSQQQNLIDTVYVIREIAAPNLQPASELSASTAYDAPKAGFYSTLEPGLKMGFR